MRTLSIAEAKARLSAVVDSVEAGEEIIITRHGRAVARIVAESPALSRDPAAIVAEQRAFLEAQPIRSERAADTVRQMRNEDRF